MACKGLTQFLQPLECLEADTRNPGNRHADPAGSGSRGLAVYNAPRFNCDPIAYPRILRHIDDMPMGQNFEANPPC